MPELGSTVELALRAWVQVSQQEDKRARELTLLPDGSFGWLSQKSAGELILVVQIREGGGGQKLSPPLPSKDHGS